MSLDIRHAGLVRGVLYSVQFEADPVDGIDQVLDRVLDGSLLDAAPSEHLAAIRAALASDEELADLLPQEYHDEETIRRYLAELARRIEARLAGA